MSTRRRIAGFILLIGVLFLGSRFLGGSHGLANVTIVYKLRPGTRAIESMAYVPGKDVPVASFSAGGIEHQREARSSTHLPAGTIRLEITVTGAHGEEPPEKRTIEVVDGAVVTIDLAEPR